MLRCKAQTSSKKKSLRNATEVILSICKFHERSDVNVKPRYICGYLLCSGKCHRERKKVPRASFFVVRDMHTDLVVLIDICHSLHQLDTKSSALFNNKWSS